MAAGDNDTEKLLEEYKKEQAECRQELKEDERAEYDARTADEKTEWLRCFATACVSGLHGEWGRVARMTLAVHRSGARQSEPAAMSAGPRVFLSRRSKSARPRQRRVASRSSTAPPASTTSALAGTCRRSSSSTSEYPPMTALRLRR